jgi:hypothetical protein
MRVPTRLFLICSVFLLASLTLFFTTIHVAAQDFLSAKIISPSELPVWAGILASGDLNGDGIPDVVYSVPQTTTSGYYSSIGVAFGSTSGLHPAGVYSQAPYTVLIADVNGDGKPDIVGGVNVGATADLLIYLNQGDGTFAAPLISQITTNNSLWPRVMGIGVGDFDGDGKADVIVSDQNGNFFCLHGTYGPVCVDRKQSEWLKGTVAVAEHDADSCALNQRHDQIQFAIVIQVRNLCNSITTDQVLLELTG